MDKTINLFVNKRVIQISPLSSLFNLKEVIKEKLFKDIDSDITIRFKGKILLQNNNSLLKLNIQNNDSLEAHPQLSGGINSTYYLLWLIYYIILILYILLLVSGFIPLFANIFATTLNSTIFSLIDKFTPKTNIFTQILRLVLRFVTWVFKNLATLFFVWILTSYIAFPWFYGQDSKYCESALAAKDAGWWVMFAFMFVYILMNIFDAIINVLIAVIDETDVKLLEAFSLPTLKIIKKAGDLMKEVIAYPIPGASRYHMFVSSMIYSLFDVGNVIGTMDCSDEKNLDGLCKLFSELKEMSKKGLSHEKVREEIGKKFNRKNAKDTDISFIEREILSEKQAMIRDYKLSPAIDLLARGFCDLRDKKGGEELEENKNYEKGSFNRWSAGFFTSFYCQLVEAVMSFQNSINQVGTESQIINMVETGNVAGCFAVIVLLVVLVWTYFSGSFGGYNFG